MTVTEIGDASSFATQLQTAKSRGILVVVDFYATWCGPCKAIAPTVESLSSKYAKEAIFLKVDVDRVSDVARDAGVTAMPSFGFYGEGRLVELMKGADARGLEERIKKYTAEYTKNPFKGPGYTLAGGTNSTPAAAASSSSRPAAAAAGGTSGTQPPRKNPWADPNFIPGKKTVSSATGSANAGAAPSSTTPSQPSTRSTTTSSSSATISTSTPAVVSAPSISSPTPVPARPPPAAAAAAASSSSPSSSSSSADPILLQQLLDMGFDRIRSEKSLILTHNRDIEEAVAWIMEHQDDADIDTPITMNGSGMNASTTTSTAASYHNAAADTVAINPADLDEDAQVLYAELMKKKAKESTASAAITSSSSSSSSSIATPAAKKVSEMSSEEKMLWLANKRAAVKAKKEHEALEKVKTDYKSTKGMTSALNDLKEQKEELERQRFIANKKKEEADKERQRRNIREKLAAQKEAGRLERERQMAALQKAKQTQAGAK